jgi:hypothetical protein
MTKKHLLAVVLLFLVSAISFLPLIGRIGYLNDDWYLMYSAGAYGPRAFIDIFSVDRPARALVMIPAYSLFGDNPLYYNLSAYFFRLISAMAFLWLLWMLFPSQSRAALLGSLFFLIYPGFLSQHNGIDYQPQMISLAAAMFSVASSVKASLMERGWQKFALFVLSTLFGWLYLGLVEYFIGFELLRWGSVLLLSWRRDGSLVQKIWRAIRWAYPSLAIPGIFLIWRLFFFQSERGATDVDLQFEQVRLYPLQTMYHWAVQVIQDLFDVMISAWAVPLSQLMGFIQQWGVALAVVAVVVALYVSHTLTNDELQEDASQLDFTREALLLGLFVAVGGLIPIAMVNRDVSFPFFSRYSLVSSAGGALFLAALAMRLRGRYLQNGFVALLVVISVLTHHANTVKASQQTSFTRDFWWQVSWRVPQFEKNTTLIVNYPGVVLEEDYFIWGPANLIYYPEEQNNENIQPGVFSAVLNRDTVNKVLVRERQEYDNRKTIITYANYRNILVLTQPSANSCIHVLDGTRPEYSRNEWDSIRVIGEYSEIDRVLVDETPHTPPTVVFGPEPLHDWCYYYQKAGLARQRGDWGEVQRIGGQAFGQGLEPGDLIEWMPFLQAYAIHGDVDRLIELAPVITADPYVSEQACRILGGMPEPSISTLEILNSHYCIE